MNSNQTTGSIGFLGVLAILFIALKLLNYITWSWMWVLAPLWMPPIITIALLATLFIAAAVRK